MNCLNEIDGEDMRWTRLSQDSGATVISHNSVVFLSIVHRRFYTGELSGSLRTTAYSLSVLQTRRRVGSLEMPARPHFM